MSKRLCPVHGMWAKTDKQVKCPLCSQHTNRAYDKQHRNKESDKFYHSKEWKNVREKVVIRDAMMCQECKRRGMNMRYDIVDHIIEINDGGSKLCLENLECLCHSCHNKKTSQSAKGRR